METVVEVAISKIVLIVVLLEQDVSVSCSGGRKSVAEYESSREEPSL